MTPGPSSSLRLLHYWWPLAMGASLTLVVHRATGRPFNPAGLAVLLSGIVAVYSLDRVGDARASEDRSWLPIVLAGTGVVASLGCLALLLRLPLRTALLAPLMAALAALYPSLKRIPFAKTLLVSIAWTWSAIAFPFNDGSWVGWTWTELPVALPLLLLIAAGCLMCDLKDAERDRTADVGSVAVLLGAGTSVGLAIGLALGGAGAAWFVQRPGLAICGLCLAVAGLRPPLLARDAVGPLIVDAILTLPGVLIATHVV